jgi:hypothetical protein
MANQMSEQEGAQLSQNTEHLRGMQINYSSPVDRYGTQIAVLTDPSDDLYNFELFLRCLKQNENGELIKIGKTLINEFGKVVKDENGNNLIEWKPLMNDVGINSILLSMHSILNTKTPLSNLDDEEIFILIFDLGKDLITNLTFNKDKYECENCNRSVIVGAATRFCYIFLKRPYGEGDRKFFKGTSQEVTHKNEITKPQGSSLNPFNYFKNK